MGAKGKQENYRSLNDEWKNKPSYVKGCLQRGTARVCRPLRIFQFLTTLVIFSMTVYMTAMPFHHLTDLASILLIVLTTSYLFFMAVDMISQFESHGLPDSPMFFFSFLGMIFFAVAGGLLIHYRAVENDFWALILVKVLCFVVAGLFLIEITMLLAYWRQKCISWTKCNPYTPCEDETKMTFLHGNPRDIDVEAGPALDAATSVSHYGAPVEDYDTAVDKHGRRKVNVGHRRQYVDRKSSVPALSIVQIASIQTDQEKTVITECQTQRTETKEIVVQTNSRCELCNRQIEDRPLSPVKLSSPAASIDSRSRYSPSPRPQPENIPYTAPPTTELPLHRGHCAICPGFLHMMRDPMSSPCCQSCNCGATEQQRSPMTYSAEPTTQHRTPQGQSPHWPQKELPRTAKTPTTVKPTESESPPTTNEKSDPERSDLVLQEGKRYRPSKKISRVFETRPCPTHGSGLAARMAGLPETVTKVTLSSICTRRNKRTQTPNRDFSILMEKEDEVITDNRRNEDANRKDFEKYRDRTKNSIGRKRSLEEHPKVLNEPEIRKRSGDPRKSNYSSSRKLYRNSEPTISQPKDPSLPTEFSEFPFRDVCRVSTREEGTIGPLTWKTEKTEIREFSKTEKIGSRLGDELPINEKSNEDNRVEESKKRPKYRQKIDTGQSSNLTIDKRQEIAEKVKNTDLQESASFSGPVLRLRLDESLDKQQSPNERSAIFDSRSNVTESRTTGRSRGLPSITESADSSKNRETPIDETIGGSSNVSSRIYRSPEAKESSISREKSVKINPGNCECIPDENEKSIGEEMSKKSWEDEQSASLIGEEEIVEKSATLDSDTDNFNTSRSKRTRSIINEDRAS